jgi:hypothetical protein
MAHLGIRSGVRTIAVGIVAASLGATAICAIAPPARADFVARPGYNFPNADAALSWQLRSSAAHYQPTPEAG